VPELARTLRRVRTRQGLRLEDISVRGGMPLAHLEALESGTVDRMPDRVALVKTLRGYANFLGLSGDQFALALVELWPTAPSAQPPVIAMQDTRSVPTAAGAPTAMVPATSFAGTPTGQAATVATPLAGSWSTTGTHQVVPGPSPTTGLATNGLADTGVTPAVVGRPHRPRRPARDRAPLWLRLVVGVVVLAILVAVAGLVIQEVQPSWLRSLGITHGHTGNTGTTGGGVNTGEGGGTATTATTARSSSTTSTQPASGNLKLTTTGPTTASFGLKGPTANVAVAAVGSPSWVQVTAPTQTAPLFSGILQPGQQQSFPVHQSLVVEVGSAAAHLSVTEGGKPAGTYVPTVAPYTITFTGS